MSASPVAGPRMPEAESFAPHVVEKLKTYVYRLIDPRNGETFYVGKGAGNRVFAHSRGELGSDSDEYRKRGAANPIKYTWR